MTAPARQPVASKVCRGPCGRELPNTDEYFRPRTWNGLGGKPLPGQRLGTCRRCNQEQTKARRREKTEIAAAVKRATGNPKWQPRVLGEDGPQGGYTEHPTDGYRWIYFPDIHGRHVDKEAFSAALALSCWFKPQRIIIGGDLADFEAISRFQSPSEAAFYMGEDITLAGWAMKQLRHYHPDTSIEALEGNHDRRWHRYMWKHPAIATVLKTKGMDLPNVLGCGEHGIKWVEAGFIKANDKFMWKHGNAARKKSAASAMAELEANGISGASGHSHRLGLHYKTNKAGVFVWCESGCLCGLEPSYAEGQTMDWQHGVSLGSVSLRGHGFTVHPIPIVKGRARILGVDISA